MAPPALARHKCCPVHQKAQPPSTYFLHETPSLPHASAFDALSLSLRMMCRNYVLFSFLDLSQTWPDNQENGGS
jgi:hypothetical protein